MNGFNQRMGIMGKKEGADFVRKNKMHKVGIDETKSSSKNEIYEIGSILLDIYKELYRRGK